MKNNRDFIEIKELAMKCLNETPKMWHILLGFTFLVIICY